MNHEIIRKCFCSYLDQFWKLSDIVPFLLVYIQLILLFKKELSQIDLNIVLERQKQLRGEKFSDKGFSDLRNSSRKKMNLDIRNNAGMVRQVMLNNLLFCALLDSEENDFFYLTEPIFEFAHKMEVSSDQLKQILESEFVGFKI
jgi:hypothetical protein